LVLPHAIGTSRHGVPHSQGHGAVDVAGILHAFADAIARPTAGSSRRAFLCRNLRGSVTFRGTGLESLPLAHWEGLMKVVVDLNACDLHGLCVEAAPEVFEIGDDGVLHVLVETPPDGLRAKVDRAVRECPTGAISIQE
jgi:ferredoxin